MHIPLISTLTLLAEVIVASLIFFVVYTGYAHNNFQKKTTEWTIGYEIIVNVGYMLYRSIAHPQSYALSSLLKVVAMAHGILSLAMLIWVVVFFLKARRGYASGENYFKKHRIVTMAFTACWLASIFSGIFLYLKVYMGVWG